VVFVCLVCVVQCTTYMMSNMGQSCADACHGAGLNCNPHIITNNSIAIFNSLGITCTPDPEPWWAEDQPSYCASPKDPNYMKCLGYLDVPSGVQCGGMWPTTQRLCACEKPDSYSAVGAFGTGLSSSFVDPVERTLLNWIVPSNTYGVITHFWATAGNPVEEDTIIRYYVDDEANASVEFLPSMACGTGFFDGQAPWGTKWFGKGAADGSWFNNFRVPFKKSVRVTYQRPAGGAGGFYMIIRGTPVPVGTSFINIGGFAVPPTAKMNLIKFNQVVQPLAWVPIADLPNARGLFFMHTLSVQSGNLNFLEGCYHLYTPYNMSFPGTVLSTGTEDYFDSGWYFNAGEFRLPVSGYTHYGSANGQVTLSAYRFHEMDPLLFDNGIRFVWRNGDAVDPAGQKCYMETGGRVVGSPTQSNVLTYAWVYTW